MKILLTLLKIFFVDLRYFTALFIRLLVIIISDLLKYKYQIDLTDIDYEVFSDGAKHILNFESPYNRETYRYTPILALITIPNHLIYYNFGKILFSFVDVLVGLAIEIILNLQKNSENRDSDKDHNKNHENKTILTTIYKYLNNPFSITSLFYLYNPVSISICTRGSADCIIAFFVLMTLIFIETGLYPIAGLCYGFAIHFKIYPVIYFPCFFLYIIYKDFKKDKLGITEKDSKETIKNKTQSTDINKIYYLFTFITYIRNKLSDIYFYFWDVVKFSFKFLNYKAFIFTILAIGTFLFYLIFFYFILGNKFLYEYLIYHLVRKDHRHNFSIFYYLIYLTYNNNFSKLLSLVTFAPQALLVGISSLALFHNINLCMVIVTMVFVSFNKVITAQYFLWYISLIPLIIPFNKMFDFKNHPGKVVYGLFMFLVWLGLDLVWNNYSHHLEYLGKNLFLELWGVNIGFFLVNCWIIKDLIGNQKN